MNKIQQLVEQHDWSIVVEVDENVGGDGTPVRFIGDTGAFRRVAAIFAAMADTVDHPEHPASRSGWHLAFNSEALPQLRLKNASFLALDCRPPTSD